MSSDRTYLQLVLCHHHLGHHSLGEKCRGQTVVIERDDEEKRQERIGVEIAARQWKVSLSAIESSRFHPAFMTDSFLNNDVREEQTWHAHAERQPPMRPGAHPVDSQDV